MKLSLGAFPSLFAASISLALGAVAEVENASILRVALRGGLVPVPVALVRLDPDWWEATTPTSTKAPTEAPSQGSLKAENKASMVSAPPAVAQLVAVLHSNEDAIQSLDNTLSGLHDRLSDAEQLGVDAAGNVSLAKSGMYKLALTSRNQADDLHTITVRASMLGSKLDQAENQLKDMRKRVILSSRSARATRLIAEKTASPSGLQAQDALNENIWKLLDPNNKNSLDATEKRVRTMEKGLDKFRGALRGEVKTALVTKMHRSAGRLRKLIHRLGAAGNQMSARNLGEGESSARLGADLGLDGD